VNPTVDHVLLSFGGADPNNYTLRVLKLLNRASRSLSVTVIMGRAYEYHAELETYVNAGHSRHQVEVLSDVKMISKHMHRADVVFTSAGRTVYEVASLGTPMIVLAQNQRELSHSFVRLENGIVNLGLGTLCDDEQVWDTFESLYDPQLRAQLQTRMLSHDLKSGVDRVIHLIFDQHRLWKTRDEI
jgi:spore coat polysaccharide biosynthesis predicted glycosyltransferase SpsG